MCTKEKVHLVQKLQSEDTDHQVEFCKWFLGHENLILCLMFTDERFLHLTNRVNRRSSRYWSDENRVGRTTPTCDGVGWYW
jgi:hypothetical protein